MFFLEPSPDFARSSQILLIASSRPAQWVLETASMVLEIRGPIEVESRYQRGSITTVGKLCHGYEPRDAAHEANRGTARPLQKVYKSVQMCTKVQKVKCYLETLQL